jgi:subtilase family serine protease
MDSLTSAILANYDQLWLVSTEPGYILSASEVQAIHGFHNAGKGILIICDSGVYDGPANQVSQVWGVSVSAQVNHCPTSVGCPISTAGFPAHDIWQGVSTIQANQNEGSISASAPAQIIASHNGFNMVAVCDDGIGRVAWDATFYRFTDYRCHLELGITFYDNAVYAHNLATWLSKGCAIRGTIRDGVTHTPVEEVLVEALRGGVAIDSVNTLSSGQYAFFGLVSGDYVIRATKSGFEVTTGDLLHYSGTSPVSADLSLWPLVGRTAPDFFVSESDITWTVLESGALTVTVIVHNSGVAADSVRVRFMEEDLSTGRSVTTQIWSDCMIDSIREGGAEASSVNYSPVSSYHRIHVIVDPENAIAETNEANNAANRLLGAIGRRPPRIVCVTAQWDGDTREDVIGRFVSGVPGQTETITSTVSDEDEDVARVEFSFGNQPIVDSVSSNGWSVNFDMGDLPAGHNVLKVTAYDAAGLTSEPKLVTIDIIAQPIWLPNIAIDTSTVGLRVGEGGGYLTFSGRLRGASVPPLSSIPPVDGVADGTAALTGGAANFFHHSFQFDPDIFLLGAKKNEITGDIFVSVSIPLSDALGPTITGYAAVRQKYLSGDDCGTSEPTWDPIWLRCRGETGYIETACCRDWKEVKVIINLSLNPDLTIKSFSGALEAEQKLLSFERDYLIPIAALPGISIVLGVGLDVIGRLGLEAGGEDNLATYYIEFKPGLSAQFNCIAGLDALAGVGRVALVLSPRFNMDGTLRCETPGGLNVNLAGSIELLYSVRGCLLWGTFCTELTSGRLGPSQFFDTNISPVPSVSGAPVLEFNTTIPSPIVYPLLRKGPHNRLGLVWVRDIDPDTSRTDPEIYSAFRDSSGAWSEAIAVTGGGGSDGSFQLNPTFAFEPSGKAVAVWTQNSLTESEANAGAFTFSQVLDRQDIYWSRWDGTSWSSPRPLMPDSTEPYRADGLPAIDIGNYGQGLVVWDRCVSDSSVVQGDREILYAVYDSTSGTFEEPEVPEDAQITDNDVDDYSPAIAYRSDGYAVAVWLRDVPGTGPMGACENEVVTMIWDGNGWSDFRVLASGSGVYSSPSVTCLPWGYALATWVVRQVAEEDSSAVYAIEAEQWYFGGATPRPTQLRAFQSPEIVYRSTFQIETPVVQIDDRSIAAIVWRGYNGFDGDLFCSVKDLETYGSTWTEPDTLTNDDLTDWMLTAAIDDQNNLHYVDLKSDLSAPPELINRGTFFDGLSIGSRGIQSDLTLSDQLNFGFRPMAADLKVVSDSFTVSNLYAAEGESVLVGSFVKNIGYAATPSSYVRFYDGNPDSGGVVIGADISIPAIYPGSGAPISQVWVAAAGTHRIYAVADPSDSMPEQTESNNCGFTTVYCVPNLAVDTVLISDDNPSQGASVTLQAVVRNTHGTASPADTLVFLASDTVPAKCAVEALAVGARDTCSLSLAAPHGRTVFRAFVDYDSTLVESDETDNSRQLILLVMPDLVVSSDSISCTQIDSLTYRYRMVLHNAGGVNAESVWIHFFDGAPLLGGTVIDSVLVSLLPARSDTAVSIDWRAPVGLTTLFVVADYRDKIAERLEDNNEGHRDFIASVRPELAIDENDISVETTDRMTFHLTSIVHNLGAASAPAVRVRFYDIPDTATMNDLGARIIPVLEDSSSAIVTFEWTRPDTLPRMVRVWVDRDSMVQEGNRLNNWAEVYIGSPSAVERRTPAVPSSVILEQNFPNPFNPITTIRYGLPKDGQARLTLYDVSGRSIIVLVDGRESAGYHTVVWRGEDAGGRPVASGVYFYRLEAGDFVATRKMVLLH